MDKNEALQRCMKLCSTKEYAPQDIKDKMVSWEISEEIALEVVAILEAEKFLNPFRFAQFYVHDKVKFNKWGRIKVRFHLKQKQIPSEAIDAAFMLLKEEDYIAILVDELRKKRKTVKTDDAYIIRGKLYQFAVGKGFEGELIHREISRLLDAEH